MYLFTSGFFLPLRTVVRCCTWARGSTGRDQGGASYRAVLRVTVAKSGLCYSKNKDSHHYEIFSVWCILWNTWRNLFSLTTAKTIFCLHCTSRKLMKWRVQTRARKGSSNFHCFLQSCYRTCFYKCLLLSKVIGDVVPVDKHRTERCWGTEAAELTQRRQMRL